MNSATPLLPTQTRYQTGRKIPATWGEKGCPFPDQSKAYRQQESRGQKIIFSLVESFLACC
uniref:Uncharacterized protein n=1 Tax=Arundo donax TaxID=35708 RepID=A0A0A9CSU6_ARUDO